MSQLYMVDGDCTQDLKEQTISPKPRDDNLQGHIDRVASDIEKPIPTRKALPEADLPAEYEQDCKDKRKTERLSLDPTISSETMQQEIASAATKRPNREDSVIGISDRTAPEPSQSEQPSRYFGPKPSEQNRDHER